MTKKFDRKTYVLEFSEPVYKYQLITALRDSEDFANIRDIKTSDLDAYLSEHGYKVCKCNGGRRC